MNFKVEKHSLGIAVIILLLQGIFTLITGINTDSNTLLIEAFKSFSGFFSSILLFRNIKLLYNPPDKKYNFGYYKLEPLVIFRQSTFLIAGGILAIFFAVQDIVNADKIRNEKIIFTTIALSFSVYLFLTAYFFIFNRKTKSGVLSILLTKWIHGLIEYTGIGIGFLISHILEHSADLSMNSISGYIDPGMTIVISLLTIYLPIRHYFASYKILMDANPGEEFTQKVEDIIQQVIRSGNQDILTPALKIRTAGRKIFITVLFKLVPTTTIKNTDTFLHKIDNRIRTDLGENVYIDYCLNSSLETTNH